MDILQNKEERLLQLKNLIEDLERSQQEIDPRLRRRMRKLERELSVLRQVFSH